MIHNQHVEPAERSYGRGNEGAAVGWRAEFLTDCKAAMRATAFSLKSLGFLLRLVITEDHPRSRL